MARQFYKTTFVIEVLSEDYTAHCNSLIELGEACHNGKYSGEVTDKTSIELSAAEMAQALIEPGSDPERFDLDEDGNDLED